MSGDKVVTVQSLNPPDHEGFMTKCGGSVHTWKKRWFVLKGNQLYYFKTKKDKKATGVILVTKESFVKEDNGKKPGKTCIALGTVERVFFMFTDTLQEQQDWLKKLTATIDRVKGSSPNTTMTTNTNTNTTTTTNTNTNTNTTMNQGTTNTNTMNPTPNMNTVNNNQNTNMNQTVQQTNTMQMPVQQPVQQQTNTMQMPVQQPVQQQTNTMQVQQTVPPTNTMQTPIGTSSAGSVLTKAKEFIPFMIDDSNKVLEFWNIWFDSIPKQDEIPPNTFPTYQLVISCDGNELSWRASGSQNIFIQKMVDFFWNVGAPESEIDRLNDFGALVNPSSIGSWINMSKIGGMDGGWFFPVPLSLKIAIEACDPDSPENVSGSEESQAVKIFTQWTETNKIDECIYVGRDMGAAPPRQTELRIKLNQPTVAEQLNAALSAFKAFKFPDIPGNILNILRQFTNPGLVLSVITSSEGFVKIGILFPNPNWNYAIQLIEEGRKLSDTQPAALDIFTKLNNSFHVNAPEFIEFQYLNPGFGYNVYKEEFNVFVHYHGQ